MNGGAGDAGEEGQVLGALGDYFGELAERKRAEPTDDLMSDMVRAADEGRLSREELISMSVLMLAAGHDTTVSLIGNAAGP